MEPMEIPIGDDDDYTDTMITWIDGLNWVAICQRNRGLVFCAESPEIAVAGLVNIRRIIEEKHG